MPLKKQYTGLRHHPQLKESPVVGNWEEAEMWNYEVKTPVNQLDNYLYTMPCEIGDVIE